MVSSSSAAHVVKGIVPLFFMFLILSSSSEAHFRKTLEINHQKGGPDDGIGSRRLAREKPITPPAPVANTRGIPHPHRMV
ncbi:hypothetical protein ACLOJK_026154 [Asimina triloba]